METVTVYRSPWQLTWDWAQDMFDAAARMMAPVNDPDYRPEQAFYNWVGRTVDDIVASGQLGDLDEIGSSDRFHILYSAVSRARVAGVPHALALDRFVRDYEGLAS